ncbi:MAG: hypothetical protein RL226_1276, partial [Bacteroidota bacterium]
MLFHKNFNFFSLVCPLMFLFSSTYGQDCGLFSIGGNNDEYLQDAILANSTDIFYTGSFAGTVDFNPGAGISLLSSSGGSRDIFISRIDTAGNFSWANRIGSTGTDRAYGMTLDHDGNLIICGYFEGTVDFNPGAGTTNLTSSGTTDIFIAKYDASGSLIWAKKIGGVGIDVAYKMDYSPLNEIVITGEFQGTVDFNPGSGTANLVASGTGDAFILKLDIDGNYIWAGKLSGTGNCTGLNVKITSDNGTLICGYYTSTVDFNPGSATVNLSSAGDTDAFVVKLNSINGFEWARSWGGTGADSMSDVTENVVFVFSFGTFSETIDLNPQAGVYSSISNGSSDIMLIKLETSSGAFSDGITWGSSSVDFSQSMALQNGEILATTAFSNNLILNIGGSNTSFVSGGGYNAMLVKINSSGLSFNGVVSSTSPWNSFASTVSVFQNTYCWGGNFSYAIEIGGVTKLNATENGTEDMFLSICSSSCEPTESNQSLSSCSEIDWFNQTLQNTGTYTHILPNAAGCDSTITLEFTRLASSASQLEIASCDEYIWFDQTLQNSGTYTHILPNAAGCDSTITLEFTRLASSASQLEIASCDEYIWFDQTLQNSGIYTHVLTNAAGCDSVITLILSITQLSNELVLTDNILQAQQELGTFSWLDCNDNFNVLATTSSPTFVAETEGSYAVLITLNECTTQSDCVTYLSTPEEISPFVTAYPNPSFDGLVYFKVNNIETTEILGCNLSGAAVSFSLQRKDDGLIVQTNHHGWLVFTLKDDKNPPAV